MAAKTRNAARRTGQETATTTPTTVLRGLGGGGDPRAVMTDSLNLAQAPGVLVASFLLHEFLTLSPQALQAAYLPQGYVEGSTV